MHILARVATAGGLWLAATASHANTLAPGEWTPFDFYDDIAAGAWVDGDLAPAAFQFSTTHSVVLTVTDAGLAGDRFEVFVNGVSGGLTSAPGNDAGDTSYDTDFDAALADVQWSHGSWTLGPGTYTITGRAVAFAPDTVGGTGALRFTPAVPEPGTWALMGVGTILVAGALRRHARG